MLTIVLAGFSMTIKPIPYYFNPQVHNFGNIGLAGRIHAELSPLARRIIDYKRYNGYNIRRKILEPYKDMSQLDMCCGIGDSVNDNCNSVGIDTSPEMLLVAKRYYPNKTFVMANAEDYYNSNQFDIVTCMFAMHEIPLHAQLRIIENGIKNAKKRFIIVDISSNYTPSRLMLSGEPYLLAYLENFNSILEDKKFKKTVYIENHVDIWEYIITI